jgi:hypothetical protein
VNLITFGLIAVSPDPEQIPAFLFRRKRGVLAVFTEWESLV